MQKEAIILSTLFIFLLSCAPQVSLSDRETLPERESSEQEKIIPPEPETNTISDPENSLGTLCSDQEKCISFCSNNRGRCEEYCRGNYETKICRVIFPPLGDESIADKNAQQQANNLKTCDERGIVMFTSPPMLLEDIAFIEPIGLMIGGHVTPIDHGYYYAKSWIPGSQRDDPMVFRNVLSPADGIVESVQSMPSEYSSSSIGDYRITIDHTCTFHTIYIHVNQLSAKLQAIADTNNKIEVKAGEVIGKAPGFDFSVHNDEVTLSGFIVPEHYAAEPWKIHTVDMFDSFVEPIKSQLLAKNVRQKEPRGGKIDYDIDGRLVGNWFEEGSNGYFGREEYRRGSGYWATHLSFAYNGLDPALIIISLGNFGNEAQQFAVKGNTPNPAAVSITSSLVKYELVDFEYFTDDGTRWDRMSFAQVAEARGTDQVAGTVLVQMVEDRKIKFEVFPEKTASQVSGFTEKVKMYER